MTSQKPKTQPNLTLDQIEAAVQEKAAVARAKDKRARWLYPIVLGVAVLVIWESYGRFVGFNPIIFSSPSGILEGLRFYAATDLWDDFLISGQEYIMGISIGIFAGIPLGFIIGSSRKLAFALDPFIDALNATPILALTPLFVIWFGLGIESKVAICAILTFFPILIAGIHGVHTVDPLLIEAAKSMGAKRRSSLFVDVVAPSTLPFIVSGLRNAIQIGTSAIVLGEFIGGIGGVGYRIYAFSNAFQTSRYLAGVLVLVAFAVVLNYLLRYAEHKLSPWKQVGGP